MNRMAAHLEHHSSQPLNTICFQYASSQAEVGQHAQDLAAFIASIPADVTEIHLVAHSLGNIVIRHYLHDTTDPQSGRQGDPRIRRLVMLGPPNQGSRMARLLKNSLLFRTVTGDSGQQLATGWNELSKKLATPQTEFAIISGGDESPSLVEQKIFGGPTDYTVSVAETQLPGAADSLVLPVVHGFMMYDEAVRDATLRFIEHGYLVSPEAKSPIQ
jgi:pimeloyl-ACP methyl ester carboxylesterase